MKFIITENRVNELILKYLKDNVTPSNYYATIWGSESHKENREEVEEYGYMSFNVDWKQAFTFYNKYGDEKNVLFVETWLSDSLTSLFDDRWEPIFKKWFEENSGLNVNTMEI